MSGLQLEEIQAHLGQHFRSVGENQSEWDRYWFAYKNEFWQRPNPWSGIAPSFSIKVQTNRIFPFVQKYIANLLFRAPRAEISMPGVYEMSRGRRGKLGKEAASKVAALANEWLKRSDLQESTTYALQLALFHGAAAYKLTPNRFPGRVVDKLGVSVLPRWDVLWDERETNYEQQLFRGHVRYERVDWVEETLKVQIPEEKRETLGGMYGEEDDNKQELRNVRRYVRVLEFYDFLSREMQYYHVIGGPGTSYPVIEKLGEAKPFPYPLANGRPGVPIVPLVVANEPSRPLAGMSAVRRIYQFNAELNLMLTILANAMRRDASRTTFVPKGVFGKEAWKAINEAKDGSIVELEVQQIRDLRELMHTFELPQFSQHLDKYRGWLIEEHASTSDITQIQQGQAGKYLSATEVEQLASAGEVSATEVGVRVTQSVARTTELALAAFAAGGKNFYVRLPDGSEEALSRAEIDQPWVVDIEDGGATPMRMAKAQAGFLQVQNVLMSLVSVASAPDIPPGPPDPSTGISAQPQQMVTHEMRAMARAQIEYIKSKWNLPDSMSWDVLVSSSAMSEQAAKEEEDRKEAEETAALEAKVRELLEAKVEQQSAAPAPVPPPEVV